MEGNSLAVRNQDPMFRGFVPVSGKRAMMKFKDVPSERLLSESAAQEFGDYAAILSNDAVVIDVDDEEESDKLYSIVCNEDVGCRVYNTSRGKHFLFKQDGRFLKNRTGAVLACGIHADIKVGYHTNAYIVRCKEGHMRECIRDVEIQSPPPFMRPVTKAEGLADMEEGDGRNSRLYSYILALQRAGFTKEESKETLEIVNTYMFANPLPKRELETIMRDDAFQEEGMNFYDKDKFMFDVFAKYLVNKMHLKKINGSLYYYNGIAYVACEKDIERQMITEIPHLSQRQRREVMAYIDVYLKESRNTADLQKIAFTNGVYDIIEDEMLPHSPDLIVTNPIPHAYNKNAYSAIADKFLDNVSDNDPELRSLIEEAMGYPFLRYNELRKSFLLYGGRHNGKSTFLDVMAQMLGEENITSMDLKDLGERFKTAELQNKMACVGDDIDDDFIKDTSIFKKIVSGDRMNVERKGKDPFDFKSYAKLFFSANAVPRMKDRTGAVLERLIIIPFTAEFEKGKPGYDPFIKYKLKKEECIEYFIKVAIDGLGRILENEEFTDAGRARVMRRMYDEENDNVLSWLTFENPDIENHTVNEVFTNYLMFCRESNLSALSKIAFSKQLRRREGYVSVSKSINGKDVRVYVKEPHRPKYEKPQKDLIEGETEGDNNEQV